MAIDINVVYEGAWCIGFVVEDGKDRTEEYLLGLQAQNKLRQLQEILAALDHIRQHGPPKSPQKFVSEGDGVFAVKCFQERIYRFFAGKNYFACAAGTTKKRDRADQTLLRIVKGIKTRYEQQQQNKARRVLEGKERERRKRR